MTVPKSAPNFIALREAINARRWDAIGGLLSTKAAIKDWSDGAFKVTDESITYEGEELPPALSKRILAMVSLGENPKAFFNFWRRLKNNPSKRSVDQLWDFLQHGGHPLTPDGCFLAYKGVTKNHKDCHTQKFNNAPGAVNEMARNLISDDPRQSCHEGFHVGALGYANGFGQRTVVCKVDPADVVCVPYDSQSMKMRVCKYRVLGNYGTKLPDHLLDDSTDGGVVPAKAEAMGDPTGGPEDLTVPRKWRAIDKMDVVALFNVSLPDLRAYASKRLNIVGASRIPGGKTSLVQAILQTRYDSEDDQADG